MSDRWTSTNAHVGSLPALLWWTASVAIGLAAIAAWTWPPAASTTSVALLLLFAVADAHPVHVRYRGRAESVVVSELAIAVGAATLPVQELVWAALGGCLLAPLTARLLGTSQRVRVAPASQHVLNAATNVIGLSPLVVLVSLVGHDGPTLWAAVGAGLFVHGVITGRLVRMAIDRAMQAPSPALSWRDVLEPLKVALGLTALALPLSALLGTEAPVWPQVLVLALALVAVSHARLGRDLASCRLTAVTEAVHQMSATSTVGELDHELRAIVGRILLAGRVDVTHAPPGAPSDPHRIVARMGEYDSWVVAEEPQLRAPWTRLDGELLDAVLAAAVGERRRLELMTRMAEGQQFAALVLSAAGHDVANQLHTAGLAVDTVLARHGRLAADDQHAILGRARAAMDRAGAALGDMVAVGASGPGSNASAGHVALAVRALSPDVRVVADNVTVAAPASIIERAVDNLVTNALRHQGHRAPLDVFIHAQGEGMVAIEVCDRGPGLSPGQVDILMQPFAQLTDQRRRRRSLGLGLFIARGLAESVGGCLSYRDRPGGGAVLTLLWPSAESSGQRVQERVVLGPGPDRDPQASLEPRLA